MVNPYIDKNSIRTFSSNTRDEDLVWHRDREDRTVTVLEGTGWSFQFDDGMPRSIIVGDIIEIPKMIFHRLLKDKTASNLVLKIERHED